MSPATTVDTSRVAGHGERAHALLSPSGAHRWLHCTPSARIEDTLPDTSTAAAKEGTAAHEQAEHLLRVALQEPSQPPELGQYDSKELHGYCEDYRDYILETVAGYEQHGTKPLLLVEQQLDLGAWIPESYGTADCVIIAEPVLHVIDFKYGKGVKVDAEDNPQLKIYALGALAAMDAVYDFTTIKTTIYQPRLNHVDTWETSYGELLSWAVKTLRPTAATAFNGEGDFKAGAWCRFCRNAPRCKPLAVYHQQAIDTYAGASPQQLTVDDIAEILHKSKEISQWLKTVEDHALKLALDGVDLPGWELYATPARRKYGDLEKVMQAVAGIEGVVKTAPVTMTEMRKILGAKTYRELIEPLLVQGEPTPALKPAGTKGQLWADNAIQDFQPIEKQP